MPQNQMINVFPNPTMCNFQITDETIRQNLTQFQFQHEINQKFMNYLIELKDYTNILILDDSGSMQNLADPDVDR